MTNKNHLIMAAKEILQHETMTTQDEICQALHKKGFDVTQVTVSRIMHQLGALKMNENSQMVYRLPAELATVTPENSLRQLIVSIDCNEAIIVVHTLPGSAGLVARLLDLDKNLGILGTIAGDDTIFITPVTIKKIKSVAKAVSISLLGK